MNSNYEYYQKRALNQQIFIEEELKHRIIENLKILLSINISNHENNNRVQIPFNEIRKLATHGG